MASDASIDTKDLRVSVQANGLIRRADTGYLIAKLCDGVAYDSLPDEASDAVSNARIEERMAEAMHNIWSHWMRWMFETGGVPEFAAGWYMHPEKEQRWRRQMNTPYKGLSEDEKGSDRKVAHEHCEFVFAEIDRLKVELAEAREQRDIMMKANKWNEKDLGLMGEACVEGHEVERQRIVDKIKTLADKRDISDVSGTAYRAACFDVIAAIEEADGALLESARLTVSVQSKLDKAVNELTEARAASDGDWHTARALMDNAVQAERQRIVTKVDVWAGPGAWLFCLKRNLLAAIEEATS